MTLFKFINHLKSGGEENPIDQRKTVSCFFDSIKIYFPKKNGFNRVI